MNHPTPSLEMEDPDAPSSQRMSSNGMASHSRSKQQEPQRRRTSSSWRAYVQFGAFALLIGNFVHCNWFVGMKTTATFFESIAPLQFQPQEISTIMEQRPTAASTTTNNAVDPQEQQLALERLQNVALIPIESYNTCDRRISHLSCLRTIILQDEQSRILPERITQLMHTSFQDALCQDYLLAKSKKDANGYIEEAHVPLCLQHLATAHVFAVVAKTDESKLQRLLLPSESSWVSTTLIASLSPGASTRTVDRKSILMPSMYLPQSPKATESRSAYSFRENVGNWVWMFGSTRLVNPFTTYFYSHLTKDDPQATALVLATANALQLNQYDDYRGPLIDWRKSIDSGLPTILLGIGIQKEFEAIQNITDELQSIKLFDFQKDLLQTIARGQSRPGITVRGELTEAACRNSGIDNCIAMGCPSLTISTLPNLGSILQRKWNRLIEELSSGSQQRQLKIFFAPPAMIGYVDGRQIAPSSRRILDIFRDVNEVHNTTVVQQERHETERKRLKEEYGLKSQTIFTHIEDWMDAMSQADLVISARIHGGMIALASTTPTIIIPTDYRIWELANIMHLPTLALDDLSAEPNTKTTVLSMLSKATVNFDAFEANRRKRLGQYEDILEEVGLEMNPKLASIVHYPQLQEERSEIRRTE